MNPARFERAASTSAGSRSYSAELRVREILEEGVGVEPTGVFRLRRFSRPLGVAHAQPSLHVAEVVGVEPTQVNFTRDREPGSRHTVRRDFHDLNLAGATRVERASSFGGRMFGVCCIASYATPLL